MNEPTHTYDTYVRYYVSYVSRWTWYITARRVDNMCTIHSNRPYESTQKLEAPSRY
jgi:hypothetical protein